MKEERNTWQKQIIHSVLKELHSHPTAQELYDELTKRGYEIGKSTVYRVLSEYVEKGQANSVYSLDKAEHFDGDVKAHYHMRCQSCGRIYDSRVKYKDDFTELSSVADEGFIILSHNIEFVCICPDCR